MSNTYLDTDKKIRLYSAQNLKGKFNEKEKLQKGFGLNVDKNAFVIGNILPLTSKNHSDYLLKAVEGLLELGSQFIMIASAEEKFQSPIESLMEKYKGQIVLIDDTSDGESDIYAIADACIFLEYNENKIKQSLSYACIPLCIANNKSIIKDFNPLLEKGNGFNISKPSMWNIVETIIRAKETYRFPYDWENLKEHCIKT